ncbi:P-loop containing nucleoside triphosphate hydrolase protein [Blastocladiella britannica]|nr:P-loop containing nucleoside triphosphate hydrolase protein [Blastocladiella britannica]
MGTRPLLLQVLLRPISAPIAALSPHRRFIHASVLSYRHQQPNAGDAPLDAIRNFGICAHVDAGKTTTTERMLYLAGFTSRLGNVDEGSTVTDFLPQERERGITIQSAAITFGWPMPMASTSTKANTRSAAKLNLIDTPGHIDFNFEVERSLRVLDGAVVVLDGVAGVEAQTATVWRQANAYRVPRFVFVNKMDRAGASLDRAVRGMQQKLTGWGSPLITQLPYMDEAVSPHASGLVGIVNVIDLAMLTWLPDGQPCAPVPLANDHPILDAARTARAELVDALAEHSDPVLDALLTSEDPMAVSSDLLHTALRECTLAGTGTPVLLGAAFRNLGVQPVLDAVVRYLPSPADRPPVRAVTVSPHVATTSHGVHKGGSAAVTVSARGGKEVAVRVEDQHLCALAFKVVFDAKRGYLTYVRVYSGVLLAKHTLLNTSTHTKERVNKLLTMYAADTEETDHISAGNIGVILGLKHTRTGDTLCSSTATPPLLLDGLAIPAPVFTCAIEPASASAAKDLDDALQHLVREDPSVSVREDPETGQVLVAGQGELHMEIIRDRLVREHKVDAAIGDVAIAYRETVTEPADFDDVYVRASHSTTSTGATTAVRVAVHVEPTGRHEHRAELIVSTDSAVVHSAVTIDLPDASPDVRHFAEEAVHSALAAGPLRGMPVTGVNVRVSTLSIAGTSTESSDASGKSPAALLLSPSAAAAAVHWAVARALRAAEPAMVEPVMHLTVRTPTNRVGDILRDLHRRDTRISQVMAAEDDPQWQVVDAEVPLAQVVGYSSAVRSHSGGAATFTMEMVGYRIGSEH